MKLMVNCVNMAVFYVDPSGRVVSNGEGFNGKGHSEDMYSFTIGGEKYYNETFKN